MHRESAGPFMEEKDMWWSRLDQILTCFSFPLFSSCNLSFDFLAFASLLISSSLSLAT